MTKTRKRILYGVLSLIGATIFGAAIYLNTLLPIITGYAAKNLCSAIFVSGRNQNDVEVVDLNFSFIRYTHNIVDYDHKSVTSSFLWGKSRAIFRDGFGTTLLTDIKEDSLRKIKYPFNAKPEYSQDTTKWPLGDLLPDSATGINLQALREISDRIINDNSYNGNAFAFMVLHKGIPVAEAYKPSFNKNTRFLSWSMAKSYTNALVGILVNQGIMDVFKPVTLEEWKNDDRSKITLNDLMQMQSGLRWNEDYGNRSNINVMLHCESDMGHFALTQPLDFPTGTHWYYSSGSCNIVNYLIRRQFKNDSLYYSFVQSQLLNKTGMSDAVFEVDPSGTIVGSSYLYATARDYARFGLLYQNDGVFNGKRILPEGWVKYSTTPALNSKGEYGAFFWLNKSRSLISAPEDMYYCNGHDGQRIFILPTQELTIVVLGYSPKPDRVMDFDKLLKDILHAL
jgi:CubicO group peptidase (beta-lactamase class C family)